MAHLAYLRHKNPSPEITRGGYLLDNSEACERSTVCARSRVSDNSSVWESVIRNSNIISSTVAHSSVTGSDVIGTLVSSGASISESLINCENVTGNVVIENCDILGASRVAHNAVCKNVKIKNLTVKGDARLLGWNNAAPLDFQFGYVGRGIWTRPPRVFRISDTITVTEGVPNFVYVHCREYDIKKLLKIGNRLGRSQNWTKQEILTIRRVLHHLSK